MAAENQTPLQEDQTPKWFLNTHLLAEKRSQRADYLLVFSYLLTEFYGKIKRR